MSELTVKDILDPQKVISVKDTDNLDHVLAAMKEHNISSVPVKSASGDTLGLVDALDILHYLVKVVKSKDTSAGAQDLSASLSQEDLGEISARSAEFKLTSIHDSKALDLSGLNPLFIVDPNANVDEVLKMFASGLHRVLVAGPEGLHAVLTQCSLLEWLGQFPDDRLKGLEDKEISSFGDIVLKDVKRINQSAKTIDALLRMKESGHRGLAVVDDDGNTVGNISATDLKLLQDRLFSVLLEPVSEYLRIVQDHAGQRWYKSKIFTVPVNAKLRDVVAKMSKHHVHRIYVIDEKNNPDKRPVGVITTADIAKILTTQK